MPKLMHRLLCNVSRRYRATHIHHVDELPLRIQRDLRNSCKEIDSRSWNNANDFMRDLVQECDAEDSKKSSFVRKAAMFA